MSDGRSDWVRTAAAVGAGAVLGAAGAWVLSNVRPGSKSPSLTAVSPLHARLLDLISTSIGPVSRFARRTPLEESRWMREGLSEEVWGDGKGPRVFVKLESAQATGSFKVRGALARVSALGGEEGVESVLTASTGNHAAAVLYAVQRLHPGLPCELFVPRTIAPGKLAKLKSLGATVTIVDSDDCALSETAARNASVERKGAVFVSPYNDEMVVAGQGTIGVEMLQQWANEEEMVEGGDAVSSPLSPSLTPRLVVCVPVGGGGMISGVAAWVKGVLGDRVWVVGCQPESNPCMYESIRAGRVLGEGEFRNDETRSDGTAGGIEEGSVTFQVCKELVDQWILVSEEDIQLAQAKMLKHHHLVVEGAAGVALAAASSLTKHWVASTDEKGAKVFQDASKKATFKEDSFSVIAISCGSNVAADTIKEIALKAAELN